MTSSQQSEKYVVYPLLGENGRLGNQLWQLASTVGYAKTHGKVPLMHEDWAYQDKFKLHGLESAGPPYRGALQLQGYLQNYSVMVPGEAEVRKLFEFSDDVKVEAVKRYGLARRENDICVHVRRGDYMQLQHLFYSLPAKYYQTAVESIVEELQGDYRVLLFSDDIPAALEMLPDATPVVPLEGEASDGDEILEMYLMSRCNHHVIANSTFSWWGAWLSGNQQVRYPDYWAHPELELHDRWRDSIPGSWVEIQSRFEGD